MAETSKQLNVVLVLGGKQALAWALSFYLPAVLAHRMAPTSHDERMVRRRILGSARDRGTRRPPGGAHRRCRRWPVHLPRLLEAAGATTAQAVAAGALIGPAQVAACLAEAGLFARFHLLVSARLSVVLHPLGACLLAPASLGAAAAAFAVLHGAGSGILTIARGTVPLAVFGPENYGYRLGLLGAPSRVAMAAAPLLFGLLIDRYGVGVLVVSSALIGVALAGLALVPISPRFSQ